MFSFLARRCGRRSAFPPSAGTASASAYPRRVAVSERHRCYFPTTPVATPSERVLPPLRTRPSVLSVTRNEFLLGPRLALGRGVVDSPVAIPRIASGAIGSSRDYRSSVARKRARARKKAAANAVPDAPSSSAELKLDGPVGKKASKGSRRSRKRRQAEREAPTTGPTGRPVMTEARWRDEGLAASLGLDDDRNHPKGILNGVTKDRLQYEQLADHEVVGQVAGQMMIMATTTTSFGRGVLGSNDDGAVDLVCTGLGTSKKRAEFYAAVDLVAALKERGIDAKDPPDARAMHQQQEKEQFKARVARAQMLLELLGSSRPMFEFLGPSKSPLWRGERWRATASLYMRGTYLSAKGPPGVTKAEAEGLAVIEMVDGEDMADHLAETGGRYAIERYQAVIDASPGGQIAALRIPPLPYEVAHDMVETVGPFNGKHQRRMEEHARVKGEFEAQFSGRRDPPGGNRRRTRSGQSRPEFTNVGLRDEELRKAERAARDPDSRRGRMKAAREALPIARIREALLHALKTGQVAVVSGGTGSGKSTQCPQYILEDAILSGRGAAAEIVVTQPRRIAATSVAERVAAERDEEVGESVGYTVRFHRKAAREAGGTVTFVTTGVLLRRIANDPTLEGVSHVIIDEVHERDINTDFLLILLRDLLRKRPDLRVVLMSATLDADSFAEYFSSPGAARCQHLSVPAAPRHPVEVFHLEDVSDDGDLPDGARGLAGSLLRYHDERLLAELEEAEEETRAAARLATRSRAEDAGLLEGGDDDGSDSDAEDGPAPSSRVEALRRAVSLGGGGGATRRAAPPRPNAVQSRARDREAGDSIVKLVAKLAYHLGKVEIDSGRKGSILCFLPGWDEIKEATSLLEAEAGLNGRMKILPLHSTIPHEDQQKVFKTAAEGTVKVILATNIAESSVTIDDVLAVVDGGLVRELRWDAESAMTTMDTVPTSRASATQRLGRAGRVAPGRCYRLYSRGALEAMPERPEPEIRRAALEATCLQTRTMAREGRVEEFLGRAMDPPQKEAVSHAVDRLVRLGALRVEDDDEVLTPLGRCLSSLPLDPATGRMLIMGAVMGCLDPVVTAAACFSSRNLFYNPPGLRDEAQEIRKSISRSSDTLAQIIAYNEFWNIENEEGWNEACSWAQGNYVSIAAMISIKAVRSQLLDELKKIGLLDSSDLTRVGYKKYALRTDAGVNRNADNELLHTAVLSAGLPGNISSRRQLGSFGTLRTRTESHAGLHPSSVMFHRKPPDGRVKLPSWYLYREMVLSSQVFLRDCTMMRPEQIVLFGGYSLKPFTKILPASDDSVHSIDVLDDWIVAESSCDDTMSVLASARRDINAALEYKVMHPRSPLPDESQSVINCICDMFDVLYDDRQWRGRIE